MNIYMRMYICYPPPKKKIASNCLFNNYCLINCYSKMPYMCQNNLIEP